MKDILLTLLTALGVIIILGLASYFPYLVIYEFTLQQMMDLVYGVLTTDHSVFRLKITLISITIAGIIVILMVLLRKASRALDLTLFEKILSGGVFYVIIATTLMLTGMWLDFRVGLPVCSDHHPYDFCRVGFFFYLEYIM